MEPKPSATSRVPTGDLRRRYEALNRLVQVSLRMSSVMGLQPLLDDIMQCAVEIAGAEAASILLVHRHTNDLYFAASTSPDAATLAGIVVPLEDSIAGSIIAAEQAVIIPDVAQHPRHFRGVDQRIAFTTRSILGVPLRIRDKLIGVLEVLNKQEGEFDDTDVQLITILASQAAIAIDTAQLIAQLRQTTDELQKLNKLKTDFISIASHELRTPLAVIMGYATFLREDVRGANREHVDELLQAAKHLSALIEGMTNLRYLEIDQGELDIKPADLGEILAEAASEASRLAATKDQIFICQPLEGQVIVLADRDRVLLVISNLVKNAVAFTPVGGQITLRAEEHGSEAWVQVRDSGRGIAPGLEEKIFEQFYQADDPMTRRQGGMGLGLTIARAVVQRHGGRIWASSGGPDRGSVFTFTLPLADPRRKPLLDRSRLSGTSPLT